MIFRIIYLNSLESMIVLSQKASIWVRMDFLKLRDLINLTILKLFYITFYFSLFVLLVGVVFLVMPSNLGYSIHQKAFINSVKKWIKIKDVRFMLFFLRRSFLV